MFRRARGDEVEIARRGLRVGRIGSGDTFVIIWGGAGWGCGGEEGVSEKGGGGGVHGDGFGGGWEDVAGDEDVRVSGTAAFGCDDVSVVGGGDFVDDADETLVPSVFMVRGAGEVSREEGAFL